jgi:arylsulfatase A-like enzyme
VSRILDMYLTWRIISATALLNTVLASGIWVHGAQSPNILIMTADNLGYGDLTSYNPESSIPTPNLERFAAEGVRLTSFYTAAPTCTVSRACLLTGRVPQRHGLTRQLPGVAGNYGVGLNHGELLIPQILKRSRTPYATGCFGKWNIGFASGSRPTERGFDEFLGHVSGNLDYFRHNYRGRHDLYIGTEELHREGEYSTDIFAAAAIDFIQRRSRQQVPWFCYLAFNAPHFPSAANKRPGQPNIWQAPNWAFEACGILPDETDPEKRYGAVVFALDHAIGQVLKALESCGAASNTFVFFMSDNGAFRLGRQGLDMGSNAPLRSGGITCWEGGLRVVAMARWPDKIKPASVVSEPLWSPDLMTACARLADAPLPKDREYDGRDPLPTLMGLKPSPHESMGFVYENHAAFRQGHLKIVRENPDQTWQLFDLRTDLSERHNLAADRQEDLMRLRAAFNAWLAATL